MNENSFSAGLLHLAKGAFEFIMKEKESLPRDAETTHSNTFISPEPTPYTPVSPDKTKSLQVLDEDEKMAETLLTISSTPVFSHAASSAPPSSVPFLSASPGKRRAGVRKQGRPLKDAKEVAIFDDVLNLPSVKLGGHPRCFMSTKRLMEGDEFVGTAEAHKMFQPKPHHPLKYNFPIGMTHIAIAYDIYFRHLAFHNRNPVERLRLKRLFGQMNESTTVKDNIYRYESIQPSFLEIYSSSQLVDPLLTNNSISIGEEKGTQTDFQDLIKAKTEKITPPVPEPRVRRTGIKVKIPKLGLLMVPKPSPESTPTSHE